MAYRSINQNALSRYKKMRIDLIASATHVCVEQVQRRDVPIAVEGLGTMQALNTATLRTQVQGTLDSVDFVDG